jgi:anti-sigma factor RsiW
MSTGCEVYAEALAERAVGRLAGEGARQLADHLAGCAECRRTLATARAVRGARVPVPEGLEERIRAAAREELATRAPAEPKRRPAPTIELRKARSGRVMRRTPAWAWGLPLAAAALATVWIGLGGPDGGSVEPTVDVASEEVEPFGGWPGADGMVAGDPLLSELTVDELETLLEDMGS